MADRCPTLLARACNGAPVVSDGVSVRRVTPTECERLQGFPDGWTDVPYRGREHPADGPRYKALGNSMAVPVVRWIGERMGEGRRPLGNYLRGYYGEPEQD